MEITFGWKESLHFGECGPKAPRGQSLGTGGALLETSLSKLALVLKAGKNVSCIS